VNINQEEKGWQWPAQAKTATARAALCHRVLRLAEACAERQGLRGEAAEECALQFLERLLLQCTWRTLQPPPAAKAGLPEAWLRRCADNFAKNMRRQRSRIHRHEAPWPEWAGSEGDSHTWDCPAVDDTPEESLLRQELARRIRQATKQLTPSQQLLFEHHYVEGASVTRLAEGTGQTPHAVSQSLFNIRKRLRAILERQGLGEDAARDYLNAASCERLRFPFPSADE